MIRLLHVDKKRVHNYTPTLQLSFFNHLDNTVISLYIRHLCIGWKNNSLSKEELIIGILLRIIVALHQFDFSVQLGVLKAITIRI